MHVNRCGYTDVMTERRLHQTETHDALQTEALKPEPDEEDGDDTRDARERHARNPGQDADDANRTRDAADGHRDDATSV